MSDSALTIANEILDLAHRLPPEAFDEALENLRKIVEFRKTLGSKPVDPRAEDKAKFDEALAKVESGRNLESMEAFGDVVKLPTVREMPKILPESFRALVNGRWQTVKCLGPVGDGRIKVETLDGMSIAVIPLAQVHQQDLKEDLR